MAHDDLNAVAMALFTHMRIFSHENGQDLKSKAYVNTSLYWIVCAVFSPLY